MISNYNSANLCVQKVEKAGACYKNSYCLVLCNGEICKLKHSSCVKSIFIIATTNQVTTLFTIKAQGTLKQTIEKIADAGYTADFVKNNGASFKAQGTLLATIEKIVDAGYK